MLSTSSSYNDSLLNPHDFSNDPLFCFFTNPGQIIYSTSNVAHVILLLPFCIFILYLGFQPLQRRSSSSSATTLSHCDIFTYHLVVMELNGALGNIISFSGSCMENEELFLTGFVMFSFTWYGQICFHTLTCVERYLAVVHPITYLCLKNEKGIRIRNYSIGCVWVFCFGGVYAVIKGNYIFFDSFLLAASTIIISFCSVSVLCVLIRPGPRKQGGERLDHSKLKAFYTIVTILGILMLRFCFGLIWAGLDLSGHTYQCVIMACASYINLPSSLVLPLLFLQRRGKLPL